MKTAAKGVGGRQTRAKSRRLFRSKLPENMETAGDGGGGGSGGGGEEELDGLEIVSVGALYKDPWAKKYWSCSRGKDRYPYPVGYHAIRTHSGCKFKLEILEDVKGPLFTITSVGGELQYGAGRTPDMAWEHFQRRSGPQVKLLHGKRLSCNVDGAEFFGFRNPLVQRLLRELVANANGPAELSLRSTDFSDSVSGAKMDIQIPKPHASMYFMSCNVVHKTGKRSKRHKVRNITTFGTIPQRTQFHGSGFMNGSEMENEELLQPLPLDGMNLPKESPVKENVVKEDNALASLGSRILGDCISETQVSQNENIDTIASDEKHHTGSSQFEGNVSSDTPNSNSERSDFDAVRHELAKSMMTVLLPRALPLLKKTYKRRRVRHSGREKADAIDDKICKHVDVICQDGTNEQKRPDYVVNKGRLHGTTIYKDPSLVIPDSIEDDQLINVTARHHSSITGGSKIFDDQDAIEDSLHDVVHIDATICNLVDEETIEPFGFVDENRSSSYASVDRKPSLCKTSFVDGKLDTPVCIDNILLNLPAQLCEDQATQITSIEPRCPLNDSSTKLDDTGNADQENLDHQHIIVPDKEACDFNGNMDISGSKPPETCLNISSRYHIEKLSESIIWQDHSENFKRETDVSMKASLPSVARSSIAAANDDLQRNFCLSSEEVVDASPALSHNIKMELSMNTANIADNSEHFLPGVNGSNTKLIFPVEPVSCSMHPAPIVSLLLTSKKDCIIVCVVCGHLERKERTLFLYEFHIHHIREKPPTFLGYTSIMMPHSSGIQEGEIAFWNSGLQFSPDGKHLVFINGFKAPRCREQNVTCPCFKCISENSEESAVQVVCIGLGYVSLVKNFMMSGSVHCILVCEPNYLLAAEESGGLHVWVMNSSWCDSVEHFNLPSSDWSEPVLQLHTIPNCASLVVGHDWTGSFFVWDLSQRALLAKYSASQHYLARVLPIGLYTNFKMEKIKEFIAVAEKFSEPSTIQCFDGQNIEDVAIFLLVSVYPENDFGSHSGRTWRLVLLAKNKVIMDDTVDFRASAANLLGGKGIIGTYDGLVYIWDLFSGGELFNIQLEKGGGILHIAADPRSKVLAVAGEDCKLCFYVMH